MDSRSRGPDPYTLLTPRCLLASRVLRLCCRAVVEKAAAADGDGSMRRLLGRGRRPHGSALGGAIGWPWRSDWRGTGCGLPWSRPPLFSRRRRTNLTSATASRQGSGTLPAHSFPARGRYVEGRAMESVRRVATRAGITDLKVQSAGPAMRCDLKSDAGWNHRSESSLGRSSNEVRAEERRGLEPAIRRAKRTDSTNSKASRCPSRKCGRDVKERARKERAKAGGGLWDYGDAQASSSARPRRRRRRQRPRRPLQQRGRLASGTERLTAEQVGRRKGAGDGQAGCDARAAGPWRRSVEVQVRPRAWPWRVSSSPLLLLLLLLLLRSHNSLQQLYLRPLTTSPPSYKHTDNTSLRTLHISRVSLVATHVPHFPSGRYHASSFPPSDDEEQAEDSVARCGQAHHLAFLSTTGCRIVHAPLLGVKTRTTPGRAGRWDVVGSAVLQILSGSRRRPAGGKAWRSRQRAASHSALEQRVGQLCLVPVSPGSDRDPKAASLSLSLSVSLSVSLSLSVSVCLCGWWIANLLCRAHFRPYDGADGSPHTGSESRGVPVGIVALAHPSPGLGKRATTVACFPLPPLGLGAPSLWS
ncbi:hypothetical protein CDD83_3035 [Cordyceps sp. RAO-2017]|nr:hypothetical protein CDD83_3035 [Cordyceps sp. RAO-2017]